MCDVINDLELEIKDDVIIKVMGVGGGGCNAVNYLYSQGIKDVSFLVCNTDKQALGRTSIPAKLQLGPGLGAGGNPEVAYAFAEQIRVSFGRLDEAGEHFYSRSLSGSVYAQKRKQLALLDRQRQLVNRDYVAIAFAKSLYSDCIHINFPPTNVLL